MNKKEFTEDEIKKIAEDNNLNISKFDINQLIKGMTVESEHWRDDEFNVVKDESDLIRIACAHLLEIPNYYDLLDKMESDAKKLNERTFKRREDSGGIHREMNDETYKLRRRAMDYIYRARDIFRKYSNREWPRINIRIVDLKPDNIKAAGYAYMNTNMIRLPASTLIKYSDNVLHEIIFHELLHAIYGIDHDETNRLMSSHVDGKLSSEEIDNLFTEYVKNKENKENEVKNYIKNVIREIMKNNRE